MRNKKIIFPVIFFLILLCVNVSFANTNHTLDNTSSKLEDSIMNSDLNIGLHPTKVNYSKGEELTFNKLNEKKTHDNKSKKNKNSKLEHHNWNVGNYSALKKAIEKSSKGDIINITKDIKIKKPINIDKTIIINGNNKKLITSNLDIALNISGNNVTIKDLKFDSNSKKYEYFIDWTGSKGSILNSDFKGFYSSNPIKWEDDTGQMERCSFGELNKNSYSKTNQSTIKTWNVRNAKQLDNSLKKCSKNDVIKITKGFKLNKTIQISKKITLNGNNNSIVCKNIDDPAFNIKSNNVTVENLEFKGVSKHPTDHLIKWKGSNGLAINCTFNNFDIEPTSNIEHNDDTISVTAKPSTEQAREYYSYKPYNKTWENYCPICHKHGTLEDNPKHVDEHEITCSECDCDFDATTGGEKSGSYKAYLVDENGNSNSKKSVDTNIGDEIDPKLINKNSQSPIEWDDKKGSLIDCTFKNFSLDNYSEDKVDKIWKLQNSFVHSMRTGKFDVESTHNPEEAWAEMNMDCKGYNLDCWTCTSWLYKSLTDAGVKCRQIYYPSDLATSGYHWVIQIKENGKWRVPVEKYANGDSYLGCTEESPKGFKVYTGNEDYE